MIDTTLRELWTIKDNIAKEHGYNLDKLVHYLRNKYQTGVDTMQVYPSASQESESALNLKAPTKIYKCRG